MAPEHIKGQPVRCSDVYALGVILYQMLVGHFPFEGPMEAVVMLQHLTKPPPPLQASRPELPPELEEVLEKALAKEVAQRYQSAGELLTAFKASFARAQKRIRRAEAERVRKAEEERVRRVEEERVRKAEEERVRKAEEERVRQAEAERIRQAQQGQQEPWNQAGMPANNPWSQQQASPWGQQAEEWLQVRPYMPPPYMPPEPNVKAFLGPIGELLELLLLTDVFIPGPVFLLLGVLGFFHVSILSGLNIDLVHRLVCLAVGLVGSILIVVLVRGHKIWPCIGYNFIVGLACLTVGIGGLVNRSFYSSYPLLSLTHVNVVDSILGLVIGVPATLGLVAYVVLNWPDR